jgi:hypothetical protein
MDLEHPTWCQPRRCRAAVGAPYAFLPLPEARILLDETAALLAQADDETTHS